MTGDAKQESAVADSSGSARQHVADRIRHLDAVDEQFRTTKPDASVQ